MEPKDLVRMSIKMAAEGKTAALPMMPPPDPSADPAAGGPPMGPMGGGMPVPAGPGGAPAPMDPMDPMDPMAAMGPVPGAEGEEAPPMPPLDPAALGLEEAPEEEMINDPSTDVDNDNKPDTMVPLKAITEHDVSLIEATKGRKTSPPKDQDQDQAAGAAEDPMASPVSSIGGPPAENPVGALEGLGAKIGEIVDQIDRDLRED